VLRSLLPWTVFRFLTVHSPQPAESRIRILLISYVRDTQVQSPRQ